MKRIVEIEENNVIHYEVQYKFLFWWETYQHNPCDYGYVIRKFSTLKEALLFINSLKKNKPKVVWQSN